MLDLEQIIQNIESGLIEFVPGRDDEESIARKYELSDRMAYYHVPGVSIALIHEDKVEWAKAYGVLQAGSEKPVTTESIFQAASSTKLLTSMIVLHCVETGRLDLDRNVNEYLRCWKIPQNDFSRKEKVTLRRILTHQSGLNRPDGGFSCEAGSSPSLVEWLEGEKPVQSRGAAVEYIPGTRWQYSNLGFLVIQALLEDVLDKPFVQIARETVLEPLGMVSSTLKDPLEPHLKDLEAMPHDGDGVPHEPQKMGAAVAHAGLMTTACDFALLALELKRAYRGVSSRILSQERVHQMLHFESDHAPEPAGFDLRQGLGVLLRGEGEKFSFLHPGSNEPGTTCWIEGFPKQGLGWVILANGAMGDVLSLEIIKAIMDEHLN